MPASEMLSERLDTGFYSSAYFDARNAIAQRGFTVEAIGSVCEPWQFGAYALCNEIIWADEKSGVPYIKAEALGAPLLDDSGLSFITRETHYLLVKSRVTPGDVVVSTSGTVGLCAVVPDRIAEANSNQDTIKFNASAAGYDSYFVAAWISSSLGQVFFRREAGGAVQQHVYLYNFRRIPLLKLSAPAQRYIGNKLRQAEVLRERARKLRANALGLVEAYIDGRLREDDLCREIGAQSYSTPPMMDGVARLTAHTKQSRVSASTLRNRLDSAYYASDVLANDATLRARGAVPLRTLIDPERSNYGVLPASEDYLPSGTEVPLIRGGDLEHGMIRLPVVDVPQKYRSARGTVLAGDVLLLIKGACIDDSAGVGLVADSDSGCVFNGSCYRIATRDSCDSGFLVACFQTRHFLLQKRREIVNTGIAYNAEESVLEFLIPAVAKTSQVFIGGMIRRSLVSSAAARSLTSAGLLLIDALVDGDIAESELIAAQCALEAGDRSRDRALLAAIRRDNAHDALPIFVDLDGLYALLDEPNGTPE